MPTWFPMAACRTRKRQHRLRRQRLLPGSRKFLPRLPCRRNPDSRRRQPMRSAKSSPWRSVWRFFSSHRPSPGRDSTFCFAIGRYVTRPPVHRSDSEAGIAGFPDQREIRPAPRGGTEVGSSTVADRPVQRDVFLNQLFSRNGMPLLLVPCMRNSNAPDSPEPTRQRRCDACRRMKHGSQHPSIRHLFPSGRISRNSPLFWRASCCMKSLPLPAM